MKLKRWKDGGTVVRYLAILLLLIASTPVSAQSSDASAPSKAHETAAGPQKRSHGGGYFVEFRVAEIGAYGHSYVVYGDGSTKRYADLHPMGGYAVMALGHVLPVPANTQWDPDVLKLPVVSSYRRSLTADEYKRLLAAVSSAKANKAPYWNAVTNNCNHFIGELAKAVGLKVPNQFQVSYSFVPSLRELNSAPAGATRASGHRASLAPGT